MRILVFLVGTKSPKLDGSTKKSIVLLAVIAPFGEGIWSIRLRRTDQLAFRLNAAHQFETSWSLASKAAL
jgi:hypothetical protein